MTYIFKRSLPSGCDVDNKFEGQKQKEEAVAEVWVKCDSDFDTVGVLKTEKKDGNEVYFGEKTDSTC